jgi:hypothetical protein
MKAAAEEDIRTKLKAAGIDPETQIPDPPPKPRGMVHNKPMPTTRRAPAPRPTVPDDNDLNADGVYDEKDIDEEYSGG